MTMRIAAIVIALFTGVSAAGTITLRTHARVPAHQPLLLADVAELSGDCPGDYAGLELRETTGDELFEVTTDDVRGALDAAGAVWSDLTLSGATCRVLPIDPEMLEARARARTTREQTEPAHEPAPQAGTVRASLEAYLRRLLDVPPERLQIEFDPADAELLSTPTVGRQVEVRPTGSGERVPIRVTVYQGERVVVERTIRAGVRILRDAVVLREPVSRGDRVPEGAVTVEPMWMPADAEPASRAEVVGAVAKITLAPGEYVQRREVERPIAIERGDRVAVRCLAGGIVVRTEAYAAESGRVGDLIELRPVVGGRRARTFTARVEGPGLAVTRAVPTEGGTR